jgi:hypothetical protein
MGAGISIEPRYARIWTNLSSIQAPEARLQMLDTLLSGSEYVTVAKRYNMYASLLQWKSATQRGEFAYWPTVMTSPPVPTAPPPMAQAMPSRAPVRASSQRIAPPPPTLMIEEGGPRMQQQQLARVPPPKRALDALNDAYAILEIDDSRPLTHEALRSAYKRAAIKAHPDKGGRPEDFDAVTKAFLYIQEVLEKLIPKTAADGSDPRFTAPVTREAALKARGITTPAHTGPINSLQIEDRDRSPIALNPKKLDMTVFNKLFEENRLPDPEKDDGYGSWLASQEPVRGASQQQMRGKYNADVFNKMFVDEAKKTGATTSALSAYRPPSEMTLAPGFGAELGGERPAQYTKPVAAGGIGYTDLKHAYGEGSTFSQEVATATLDGRPKTLEEAKREYGSAPRNFSAEEAAAVAAFDKAKEAAEIARQRRVAARDVDADSLHTRMKNRLMIQS